MIRPERYRLFGQLLLRCYRSFSRNLLVSLLPLLMPIVFLLLFLDATQDAAEAPKIRLAITAEQAAHPVIDALAESGLVRIGEAPESDAVLNRIDARLYDALLTSRRDPPHESLLLVRPGFRQWIEAALEMSRQGRSSATSAALPAIQDLEADRNDYLAFILPGLFVMVLIQLSMTSTASVVLNDRADGTFRLVSSVKGAMAPLIAAELSFRLFFALLCYCCMMLAVWSATDGWLSDRWGSFSLLFALGATMMIAFGYTLGGILPGRRNWTSVITLLGLAFWFFSDILFQASQHPLARPLALLLPPTYLTDALRQVSTGRPGTFPLYADISVMSATLLLCVATSLRCFRFETNDDRL